MDRLIEPYRRGASARPRGEHLLHGSGGDRKPRPQQQAARRAALAASEVRFAARLDRDHMRADRL